MPKNEPARKAAYKVCRRFGIPSSAKHSEIVKIIEEYTYEVIPFDPLRLDSGGIGTLINQLGLQEEVMRHNAFVYIKGSLKFVFLNSTLSENDKCVVLLHELGHICDPSFNEPEAIYSKVQRESFADDFAFYMLHPSLLTRINCAERRTKLLRFCVLRCVWVYSAAMRTAVRCAQIRRYITSQERAKGTIRKTASLSRARTICGVLPKSRRRNTDIRRVRSASLNNG